MTQGSARINRRQPLVPPGGIDRQRRLAALEAARKRYVGLSAIGKRRLLDELQDLTGYHRKSLLRLLNRPVPMAAAEAGGSLPQPDKTHHRRRYGPEVVEALIPLWEASDRLCGKRLQALLPLLVESLESHGHLSLEPAVRESLLAMSSATIDRLLAPIRKQSGSNGWRRPPRAYSAVRRRVPVRTFKGWDDHNDPGWLEIDLVAHCGGRMEGRFLWTLMATDIATGWSESLPILMRAGALVLTALQLIRRPLPFPLRGIDADNDPVFMNHLMEAWCDSPGQQIVLTRSRAYKSNDQAWVEQKNGMLVRRVVGYQRLVSLEAARVLGELYGALRLFTNLFQPSFKLKSSERDGGRIKRQHHPPRTPLQRLLATGQLSEEKAAPLTPELLALGFTPPRPKFIRLGGYLMAPFLGAGQFLPKPMRSSAVGVAQIDVRAVGLAIRHKSILYRHPRFDEGFVCERDYRRFARIQREVFSTALQLMRSYRRLKKAYRAAYPEMVSTESWKKRCGIN